MAKTNQILSGEDVEQITRDVVGEVTKLLKSEQRKLRKDGASPEDDGDETNPAGANVPPSAEGSAEDPSTSAADPGEAPGEPNGDPNQGQDPASEGQDGGQIDVQDLQRQYSELGMEELQAHYIALKGAIEMKMGSGAEGGAPDASGGGAPPPPPGPQGGPPGPAMKSAMEMFGRQLAKTVKEEMDSRIAGVNKQLQALTKFMEASVERPMRKAQTTVNVTAVAKPGTERTEQEPSRAVVMAKLNKATKDPSMKVTDRALVNRYVAHDVGFADIKHIFAAAE